MKNLQLWHFLGLWTESVAQPGVLLLSNRPVAPSVGRSSLYPYHYHQRLPTTTWKLVTVNASTAACLVATKIKQDDAFYQRILLLAQSLLVDNHFHTMIPNTYVSLRLRVQNAVSAQPCVGKLGISLVLLNFLDCNFRLWLETP